MRRITVFLVVLTAVAISAATARAAEWGMGFKERVVLAAIEIAPAGLRAMLPTDPAAVSAAVQETPTLTNNGKRDPEEHTAQVRQMLKKPNVDPQRLLAELAALATYAMDKTAPDASRIFFAAVAGSEDVGADRFDGYWCVVHFNQLLAIVRTVAEPTRSELEKEAPNAAKLASVKVADDLALLFDLYVNTAVSVWATLTKDAGIPFGEEPAAGLRIAPKIRNFQAGGVFRPTIGVDIGVLTARVVAEGKKSGALTDLNSTAAGGAKKSTDEFVFDDGATVSGAEAKQGAQQLASSDVHVDARGMDRNTGLDEDTKAALNKLGIDVGASSRRDFKGTRGGVQPGQIVKAGDFEIKLDNLSTVEVGARDQRQVYMQVPDAAVSGASAGQLNQKAVVAVISANIGAFKTCFERRLREIPDLAGRVFVQFTVGVDGQISKVSLLQNTTGDAPFADCLVRQVQRLRFPPPKGGDASFVFPFIFEQVYSN